ncbi:PH domain-containing protein [Streptococcus ovuberis]|uniref:PH domain-containing protein n=1 Tax=Streptococcus ovuberis TaxID=1936207 RepID=A0A7X6N1N6_9STRE|nr:PH domain-containing protein [Streptococcus ovuberis]NKZ21326.1 PH domain-containing protein [Streptococcus ovuberis]
MKEVLIKRGLCVTLLELVSSSALAIGFVYWAILGFLENHFLIPLVCLIIGVLGVIGCITLVYQILSGAPVMKLAVEGVQIRSWFRKPFIPWSDIKIVNDHEWHDGIVIPISAVLI